MLVARRLVGTGTETKAPPANQRENLVPNDSHPPRVHATEASNPCSQGVGSEVDAAPNNRHCRHILKFNKLQLLKGP